MNIPDELGCPVARREFISKLAAAGTTLCFANLCSLSETFAKENLDEKSFKENIAKNSNLTYEQVYNFAFRDSLLPGIVALANKFGREKFVQMLTEATDEAWVEKEPNVRFSKNLNSEFWNNVLEFKELEKTPEKTVSRVDNCLWAKTFREAKAEDIGYALVCYIDFPNARRKGQLLERPKCLMKGDDCCHFEWTKKT